jgi:ParB family transcriptional regulator, chromosome partitioning protein
MMEKKSDRRALGRGLSALMSDVALAAPSAPESDGRTERRIAIDRITPNPHQPRRDFDPTALQELADSIGQKGVIQPLVVRPIAGTDSFQIVAGERRWRAAQIAKIHEVPAVVRDYSDEEVLEVAIIENIQRADLNAIEEAIGFRQLIDQYGHTQEKLAEALSKSRSHIANLLRLLNLPEDVQTLVRNGKLSGGHARALVTSANASALAQMVVARGLSVREVERLVKKSDDATSFPGPKGRPATEKDADTRALEQDVSANLGMFVRIDHEPGGESGQMIIRYRTLDDLDMLCTVLSQIRRDVLAM